MILRKCETCSKDIPRRTKWSSAYYATRRFCDLACRDGERADLTSYVVQDSGCWEWQGRLDRNGYGKGYDASRPSGQRVDWVHRISYRHHKGEIPPRHDIDHTCENTRCINPGHLEAVTRAEHARRTMQRLGADTKQLRAAALRAGGLTYDEVASSLGLASRQAAYYMVRRASEKGLVA